DGCARADREQQGTGRGDAAPADRGDGIAADRLRARVPPAAGTDLPGGPGAPAPSPAAPRAHAAAGRAAALLRLRLPRDRGVRAFAPAAQRGAARLDAARDGIVARARDAALHRPADTAGSLTCACAGHT